MTHRYCHRACQTAYQKCFGIQKHILNPKNSFSPKNLMKIAFQEYNTSSCQNRLKIQKLQKNALFPFYPKLRQIWMNCIYDLKRRSNDILMCQILINVTPNRDLTERLPPGGGGTSAWIRIFCGGSCVDPPLIRFSEAPLPVPPPLTPSTCHGSLYDQFRVNISKNIDVNLQNMLK